MVDAEARQPSNGVTAAQVIQTDNALALVLGQHVVYNQRTSFTSALRPTRSQYTPPTRLNSTVASRRPCVLGFIRSVESLVLVLTHQRMQTGTAACSINKADPTKTRIL